jgi:hypothetical protein
MQTRQVIRQIPFEKLRPSMHYGRQASVCFGVAVAVVLLGHALFPGWTAVPQSLASLTAAWAFYGLLKRWPRLTQWLEMAALRPHLRKSRSLNDSARPNEHSKLVAWTRSGEVVELVFDGGSWMLVKSDVNDTQWRDVQRLLVWCKRMPSRAVV